MSIDITPEMRAVAETECRLGLAEYAEANPPPAEPLDLWVEGFWRGMQAAFSPMTPAQAEMQLALIQARHSGLTR